MAFSLFFIPYLQEFVTQNINKRINGTVRQEQNLCLKLLEVLAVQVKGGPCFIVKNAEPFSFNPFKTIYVRINQIFVATFYH
jgi:hypothetical protein